mgnify:CR=1 FL=1
MKKNVKILIIVLASIVVLAGLAVGGYFLSLHFTKVKALKAVDEVFVSLKSGDVNQLKKYINLSDSESNSDEVTDGNEEDDDNKTALIMLKNLNYEVVDTDIGFKNCTITLNVSNKDIKTVFSKYISNLFSLAISSAFGQITEEELNQKAEETLEKEYNSDEVETVTNPLTLNLVKENGKWNVEFDKTELLNAVLPGYTEVIESLSSISIGE